MQVSVRLVEPGEYSLLARIGRETFYETWKDYNTPEDMQTYLLDAFDEEKIKKDLENRDVNTFLFVFANEEPVGYAKIRRDRTYDEFKDAKVIEVERIYIYQSFQKQQAGKALMDLAGSEHRQPQSHQFLQSVWIRNFRIQNVQIG